MIYILLIAGLLAIYAILSLFFYEVLNKGETLRKIRRCWYSSCLLAFSVFINLRPPKSMEGYNKLLVPHQVWDLIILFIAFIIVGFIVDALIIRTTSLGEFKFGGFGGKFLGEETKKNLKEQINNIEMIYDKIQAEYEVIQDLEKYDEAFRGKTFGR